MARTAYLYFFLFCLFLLANIIAINNNLYAQGGPLNGSGGGIIAFVSDRDGSHEIYLMNADGSTQTRVTNDSGFDFGLSWSPDGQRLAFISSLHSGFELYVMDVVDITNAVFSNPLRLTNNSVMDMSPTWSPDGTKIAYTSGGSGIVIMDMVNSNITTVNTSSVVGSQPSWSPVDNIISFSGLSGSNQNIYKINVNSTNQEQVTFHNSDLVPDWSPDGTKIAYVTTNNGAEDIYIIDSDGSGDRRLTTSPENDFVPSWSPQGNRIVYEGSVNGVDQICVIDTNGSNYQQLTSLGNNTGPCWKPAGINSIPADENPRIIPKHIQLYQNYPNPFNNETQISFELNQPSVITLRIFDISGSLIDIPVSNKYFDLGYQSLKYNAENLSSGIYYYQIISKSGDYVIKKMCLLK
ncbi:T9SS type A sorting domain-containing protein [Calditrichota bacterium]